MRDDHPDEKPESKPDESQGMIREEKTSMHGMAGIGLRVGTGSSVVSQWKSSSVFVFLVGSPMGSIFLGLTGVLGLAYLYYFRSFRSGRLWGIALIGFVIDFILTILAVYGIPSEILVGPLAPVPFVVGSLATLVAGVFVGIVARKDFVKCVLAMVLLDFFVTGLITTFPVSLELVSRMCVGFFSALLGGYLGRYYDKEHSIKYIGNTLTTLLVTIISGLALAWLLGNL